jgi:hypothetical protein
LFGFLLDSAFDGPQTRDPGLCNSRNRRPLAMGETYSACTASPGELSGNPRRRA